MGCHPDQVEEFNAKVKERGISGVHYEPGTGVCVFSSRRGRNEEQRARSFFDQDAGYGDAMPNNV